MRAARIAWNAALLVLGTSCLQVQAQHSSRPTPTPAPTPPPQHGGYGDGGAPAGGVAAKASSGAVGTPTPAARPTVAPRPDWFIAAQSRIKAVVDALGAREKSGTDYWQQKIKGKIDQRVREILQQSGLTAGEIPHYYTPAQNQDLPESVVTGFYEGNARVLKSLDLFRLGNAPDYLGNLLYPDGNRKAIENVADAAEADLKLFAFYDDKVQQIYPNLIEFQARYVADKALKAKEDDVVSQLERSYDSGSYFDSHNSEVTEQLRAARQVQDSYAERNDAMESMYDWHTYATGIFSYSLFARTAWAASHASYPVFQRTGQLIDILSAAKRLEVVRESVEKFFYGALTSYDWPLAAPEDVDLRSLDVSYMYMINTTIGKAMGRPGIPDGDLKAFEDQAYRLLDLSGAVAAFLKQTFQLRQQMYQNEYTIDNLDHQISEKQAYEGKIWSSATEAQVTEINAQINALETTEDGDKKAGTALVPVMNGDIEAFKAQLAFAGSPKPLPQNRVRGVWIAFGPETWPTKQTVLSEPLKGAPLGHVDHTQFPAITLGVPGTIVVETSGEDSTTCPVSMPLTVTVGGATASVTLRLEPDFSYRSDPIVLQLSGAGGSTTPPGTVDRGVYPDDITGSWDVSYEDLALGEVDGSAVIDQDGAHTTVYVHHPQTGKQYTLESTSISFGDGVYTIRLAGESPAADQLAPDAQTIKQSTEALAADAQSASLAVNPFTGRAFPTPPVLNLPPENDGSVGGLTVVARTKATVPQPISFPADASAIQVDVAEYTGKADVTLGPPVETNLVTLRLHLVQAASSADVLAGKPQVLLKGTWVFEADPGSRRDGAGHGRVGYFRRLLASQNVATQSATEIWTRGVPRMQLFAVCDENYKVIDKLYTGVPTAVEVVFLEPQSDETLPIKIEAPGGTITVTAHRDWEDYRRFITDPFVPGMDGRPQPAPSGTPQSPPEDQPTPAGPY